MGLRITQLDDATQYLESFKEMYFVVDKGDDQPTMKLSGAQLLDRLGVDMTDPVFSTLTVTGESLFGGLATFNSGITVKGLTTLEDLIATGDTTLGDVEIGGNAMFHQNLSSDGFLSGFVGGLGWSILPYTQINAAGVAETKYKLEIDDISVRNSLKVYEFVISQLMGENDNVIFAGMMEVLRYEASTNRIYLDTQEGELYNPFRAGDILMVQQYNGMPSEDNNYSITKSYELVVEEASIGNTSDGESREDYIVISNFVGDLSNIAEGDVLTRVDNLTDSTRKGIIKITTIDEVGAPYLDVVYGLKTDPDNATKARLGSLEGIITKQGKQLSGFGVYLNSAYIENSNILLADGSTIEQTFEVMSGAFMSEINALKTVVNEGGNVLYNASFTESLYGWQVTNNVSLLESESLYLWFNGGTMAYKPVVADIITDGTTTKLRLRNNGVVQDKSYFEDAIEFTSTEDEDGEEVVNARKLVVSMSVKCIKSGSFSYGVKNSSVLYATIDLTAGDEIDLKLEGEVTSLDDFEITTTGEVYVSSVLLGDGYTSLELYTLIEQTSESIKVQATLINSLTNTIETAGWITSAQGNTLYASKSLENGDTIASYITQSATALDLIAQNINLTGLVTFSSLSSSLQSDINSKLESGEIDISDLSASAQSTINAKANTSSLGDLAYLSSVYSAMEDETIIVGGYLKTSLINVDTLYVTKLLGATGTFSGELSGATGSFTGTVTASYLRTTGSFSLDSSEYTLTSSNSLFDPSGRSIVYVTPNGGNLLTLATTSASALRDGFILVLHNAGSSYFNIQSENRTGLMTVYANQTATLSYNGDRGRWFLIGFCADSELGSFYN